jgi:tRNA 2-thiouridine synthesizing protein C
MKKISIVQRRPPYGTSFAKEALDVVLMASAFEQEISMIFLDDAVWQLKSNQDTNVIGLKNFSATFKALELYEVKKIFVELESLQQRGVQETDLLLPVTVLSSSDLSQLLQQQDLILSF